MTMRYAAPISERMGVSLELTAAMAGLLGNMGLHGELGGTALRAMLTRLAAPTDEAAATLERLNVQVSDQNGNLRDIPTILAEMDRAMQGLGQATREDLLSAIFGMEASGAAAAFAAAPASGELQAHAERLRETGSAARAFEARPASAGRATPPPWPAPLPRAGRCARGSGIASTNRASKESCP